MIFPQDRGSPILPADGEANTGHSLHAGRLRAGGDLPKFRVGEPHSPPAKCAFLSLIKGYCKKSNKNVFVFNN